MLLTVITLDKGYRYDRRHKCKLITAQQQIDLSQTRVLQNILRPLQMKCILTIPFMFIRLTIYIFLTKCNIEVTLRILTCERDISDHNLLILYYVKPVLVIFWLKFTFQNITQTFFTQIICRLVKHFKTCVRSTFPKIYEIEISILNLFKFKVALKGFLTHL